MIVILIVSVFVILYFINYSIDGGAKALKGVNPRIITGILNNMKETFITLAEETSPNKQNSYYVKKIKSVTDIGALKSVILNSSVKPDNRPNYDYLPSDFAKIVFLLKKAEIVDKKGTRLNELNNREFYILFAAIKGPESEEMKKYNNIYNPQERVDNFKGLENLIISGRNNYSKDYGTNELVLGVPKLIKKLKSVLDIVEPKKEIRILRKQGYGKAADLLQRTIDTDPTNITIDSIGNVLAIEWVEKTDLTPEQEQQVEDNADKFMLILKSDPESEKLFIDNLIEIAKPENQKLLGMGDSSEQSIVKLVGNKLISKEPTTEELKELVVLVETVKKKLEVAMYNPKFQMQTRMIIGLKVLLPQFINIEDTRTMAKVFSAVAKAVTTIGDEPTNLMSKMLNMVDDMGIQINLSENLQFKNAIRVLEGSSPALLLGSITGTNTPLGRITSSTTEIGQILPPEVTAAPLPAPKLTATPVVLAEKQEVPQFSPAVVQPTAAQTAEIARLKNIKYQRDNEVNRLRQLLLQREEELQELKRTITISF